MSANCFSNLPDYDVLACPINQQADIDAIAIIDQDQSDITSWNNATQWNNAITAGDVKIMKDIRAWIPEPAERTQPNGRTRGPENILTGYTLSINFEDLNVSDDNDAFYSALNGRTAYAAVRFYYEHTIRVGLFPFYWIAKPVSGETGTILKYVGNGTVKIGPDDYMANYTEPAGIFD